MGLFFQSIPSASWRKPLQLIECWLPEPDGHARPSTRPGTRPSALATPAMRRFTKAGWLGRNAANEPHGPAPRHDGRVALAGRIDDVCRELDRLAASESASRWLVRRR